MSATPVIDEQKAAARIAELLGDRDWRLSNLYHIRDEEGRTVLFKPNDAQRAFDEAMWFRNVIPKARKLGFSTYIAIFILDECLINSGTVCGITDKTITDAEDKLAMIRFAYDRIPVSVLKDAVRLVRANDKYLEWSNGSSVSVGLTYRGGTPRILHVSEFGKVAVDSPDQANEIMTGAIQAVPQSGFVFVESTAHGTSGKFCDMVQKAEGLRIAGTPLTRLDFKSQFFGWMHKREYRVPNHLVIVPQELRDYFATLELKHGIKTDADQQAWYTKKWEELGPDDVKSEFPSIPEELFFASLEGAFWKREILKARQEGRIGGIVPHDPSRRVNTFWDIGEDGTAVICHQSDGVRHRLVDYFEEEGGSLQSACAWLDLKSRERGFVYGDHYFPHDLDRRVWDANAVNRKKIATDLLGKAPIIVPQVSDKDDSIEAARRFLNMCWIDQRFCARLVEVIENYRRKWNKQLGQFMAEPVHDWASHGSDALQQGAMGLKPEKAPKGGTRHPIDTPKKPSAWAQ